MEILWVGNSLSWLLVCMTETKSQRLICFTFWSLLFIAQATLSRATKQLMPTPRGRRPPPYSGGRVWSIVLCVSRGDDRALFGLWGDEAEKTGHRANLLAVLWFKFAWVGNYGPAPPVPPASLPLSSGWNVTVDLLCLATKSTHHEGYSFMLISVGSMAKKIKLWLDLVLKNHSKN